MNTSHSEPIKHWLHWGLLALAVSSIAAVIMSPPFVPPAWRVVIMTGFSAVCHQLPERTLHIDHVSIAVCHRCSGIYLGLVVMVLCFPVVRGLAILSSWAAALLAMSLGVLAFDWLAPYLGIVENTPLSRFGTGLFFGCMAGYYLARVILSRRNVLQPGPIEIAGRNFV